MWVIGVGVAAIVIGAAVAVWLRVRPPHEWNTRVATPRWVATLLAAVGLLLASGIAERASTLTSALIAAAIITTLTTVILRPDVRTRRA